MTGPYSDELRCKILEAWESGKGSFRQLAEEFGVSWGYVKKIRAQQLRTGHANRPLQSHHGPSGQITETVRKRIRSWLQRKPALTQVELRNRLAKIGITVSISRVGQVLRQMRGQASDRKQVEGATYD